jgi:hypothetical protein
MKVSIVSLALLFTVSLFFVGCKSTSQRPARASNYAGAFSPTGLPSAAFLVGGGWDISYLTPARGTLILAEANTAQILLTRSVEAGHLFEIDLLQTDSRQHENFFGRPVTQIRFNLYFIPARGDVQVRTSSREQLR